jgi:hypothetical protein
MGDRGGDDLHVGFEGLAVTFAGQFLDRGLWDKSAAKNAEGISNAGMKQKD